MCVCVWLPACLSGRGEGGDPGALYTSNIYLCPRKCKHRLGCSFGSFGGQAFLMFPSRNHSEADLESCARIYTICLFFVSLSFTFSFHRVSFCPLRFLTLLGPQSYMWGQTTPFVSGLPPKRDCGPKRVKTAVYPSSWLPLPLLYCCSLFRTYSYPGYTFFVAVLIFASASSSFTFVCIIVSRQSPADDDPIIWSGF